MPHWCKFCPPQLKTHFSLSLFNLNEITLTVPGSSDIYLTIITLHTLSIFNKTWETIFCSQQQMWLLVPFYLEQINKWKLRTTYFSEGQGLLAKTHHVIFTNQELSVAPAVTFFYRVPFAFLLFFCCKKLEWQFVSRLWVQSDSPSCSLESSGLLRIFAC